MNSDTQPIGTGVIVLNETRDKILLGKRLNNYKAGTYGLPGGRLDLKEPLENCAKRELLEETGLRAQELKFVGTVRDLQEGYNFIHFIFSTDTYSGEPKNLEPEKCEGWEWFSLNNLPENILPGHKAGIEILALIP